MSNGAEKRIRRTRARIVAAAEPLFLQKGFLGTNMDEVAAAAGVSKQTVYAHFGTKKALFVGIVEAMTGGAAEALKDRVDDPPSDQPVGAFLLAFATEQLDIVLTPRLMQLRRLVIGEAGRFPDLGQALHRRGPTRSIDRLTQAFERYSAKGDLHLPDARSAAANFNWLLMGGPTSDAMLLGDTALPGPAARRTHAEECVRVFLAAYGAK